MRVILNLLGGWSKTGNRLPIPSPQYQAEAPELRERWIPLFTGPALRRI